MKLVKLNILITDVCKYVFVFVHTFLVLSVWHWNTASVLYSLSAYISCYCDCPLSLVLQHTPQDWYRRGSQRNYQCLFGRQWNDAPLSCQRRKPAREPGSAEHPGQSSYFLSSFLPFFLSPFSPHHSGFATETSYLPRLVSGWFWPICLPSWACGRGESQVDCSSWVQPM